MELVFFLLRHSRAVVLLAVFTGIVSGLTNVGLLLLIRKVMHGLRRHDASTPGLGWYFLVLCVAAVLAKVVSQTMLINLSRRSIAHLSMTLSHRILAAPLRQLEELGPTRLLMMLTSDVPTIAQGLRNIPTLCVNSVIVAACLAYLAWLDHRLFLVLLVLLIVGLILQRALSRRARRAMRAARKKGDAVNKKYRDLVEGVKELKLHRPRREAFLSGSLRSAADALEKQNTRAQLFLAVASTGGRFLFFLVVGFLVFVGPHLLANLKVDVVANYVIAMMFLMAPLQSFGAAIPQLMRAEVALKHITRLGKSLRNRSRQKTAGEQAPLGPSWSSLELAGVTHAYEHERDGTGFTLGPIDLTFKPGELVFLVGGNGSGKTTLAKLLVGLYHPESGAIRLDGKPIMGNQDNYRQLFSVVYDDVYLFDELLGMEQANLDQQARAWLAELHLDQKVTVRDGALSTTALSRGQRKRLALLTAYLEDRPIYVFDEWASDQDPLFKEVFYTHILPRLKERGKLVVAITHDDRYFHLADRVVHLREGKIVVDPNPTPTTGCEDSTRGNDLKTTHKGF
jgi:putative ATP-binding cassette transporter